MKYSIHKRTLQEFYIFWLCVEISRLESKSARFSLLVTPNPRPNNIRRFAVDVMGAARV